ncbi:MAG: phosphoadenosine phosphosulfate reductase family protein [Candidatus Thorarchaeota archaeon]
MDQAWIKTFLMHGKTYLFNQRLEKTRNFIKNKLSIYKKPYIAYSGGKDSTVMIHLMIQENSDIHVLHWDYGPYLVPRNIEEKIIENAKQIGVKNLLVLTSNLYIKLKRNLKNVWGSEFMDKELPKLRDKGFDCSFIGLRSEESCKRKSKTRYKQGRDKYMDNIYPLTDWTYKDIYAYLLKFNVPYLKEHYDKYGKVLGYKNARFVTFFDPDFPENRALDGLLMWKFKNM